MGSEHVRPSSTTPRADFEPRHWTRNAPYIPYNPYERSSRMGWEYVLEPIDSDFSDEAHAEVQTFLDGLPAYRRSDGVYVIASSVEHRDAIVESGTKDNVRYGMETVNPCPTGISFGVCGDDGMARKFADFMSSFQRRWPCELVGLDGDGLMGLMSIEQFLENQLEMNLPEEERRDRSQRRAEAREMRGEAADKG